MNWVRDMMRKAGTRTHLRLAADARGKDPLSLLEIHRAHAGKATDKWSGYFGIYDRLLLPVRHRPIALLEVGIQNGGSLEVWAQYFPASMTIIGVDIDSKCAGLRFDDPRIRIIVGDINSDATLAAVHRQAELFDLIIDDGSHVSGDVVRAFCHLWPRLAEGGLYIVEDMSCSYWSAFDGGLHHPASSGAFFKSLSDCINAEHWGNGQMPVSHISSILERHEAALTDDLVTQVHSIEIANSMVTIRKAAPERNRMGKRVVGGRTALINPGVLALDGTGWISQEQDNPWAYAPVEPVAQAGSNAGYCPCCEQVTEFWERGPWLRDHYLCRICKSIPRMRALQHVLRSQFPDWKHSSIHESSPSNRNIEQFCSDYSSSQYYGNERLGSAIPGGVRNENLECLTFSDDSFDIFVTMDVLEHVFHPDLACREIMRVLKPGGAHVFTAPKHKGLISSYPRARLRNGEVEHILPPEYHGNPIGDGRSLVTWDYGADFETYLATWSGYPITTYVTRDRSLGLDGEYLEVFVVRKLTLR